MSLREKSAAAATSVISNSILVVLKFTVGIMMGSVGVLSEALHSGLDLAAAIIAFFSVREAAKPPDEVHRYGHGKVENISGSIEALLVLLAGLWIIYEALQRLSKNSPVESIGIGVFVMLVSAVVNVFVSRKLMRVARAEDSVALEADALHLRTDVYSSLGVAAGLGAIYLTGWTWVDPVLAVVVAAMILKVGYRLTAKTLLPLLDVRLPIDEEVEIRSIIQEHAGEYVEFHNLRTRKAGPQRYIDLHLVVPKGEHVEEVHGLCHHLARDIEERYPLSQVMVHVEPCRDNCPECSRSHTDTCEK